MVRKCGGEEATDQVACNIARYIGREGSGGRSGGAFFAEIGERKSERGRHEHALDHAQRGEQPQIRHRREQCRRNR
jgi:hypothetical protein